jgi:hypothetical protein
MLSKNRQGKNKKEAKNILTAGWRMLVSKTIEVVQQIVTARCGKLANRAGYGRASNGHYSQTFNAHTST